MDKNKDKKHLIVSCIILGLVVLNFFSTYFIFMQIEYSKVGGKDNYELLNKLQLQQIQQLVEYYKANPQMIDQQATGGQAGGTQEPQGTQQNTPVAQPSSTGAVSQ